VKSRDNKNTEINSGPDRQNENGERSEGIGEWTLCPDPECAIPASRAKGHAICADSQAAHTVLMTGKYTNAFSFQGVPDIACPVIISSKKNAA